MLWPVSTVSGGAATAGVGAGPTTIPVVLLSAPLPVKSASLRLAVGIILGKDMYRDSKM